MRIHSWQFFSVSNENSAVCNNFIRSPQEQKLKRPPEWPRNPQHVARAATHRKAGYFARKLKKLWEMDLLPFEIVAAIFPQFGNTHHANVLEVIQAVHECKLGLDYVYSETHDSKLQKNIEQARLIFDLCLDCMSREPEALAFN